MRFMSAVHALSCASPIVTRSAPSIRSNATSWPPWSTMATESATRIRRPSAMAAFIIDFAAPSVRPAACEAVGQRNESTLSSGKRSVESVASAMRDLLCKGQESLERSLGNSVVPRDWPGRELGNHDLRGAVHEHGLPVDPGAAVDRRSRVVHPELVPVVRAGMAGLVLGRAVCLDRFGVRGGRVTD